MYDKYVQSMAEDLEKVLGQMAGIYIHRTVVKKEQRPEAQYPLTYAVKFQHLHKNIKGAVYFSFNDLECANSMAKSIKNKAGIFEDAVSKDDYLCEFMNNAIGRVVTGWEKIGFNATFEPPKILKNCALNIQFYGCQRYIIVMVFDVYQFLFEVVFIDGSYDVLTGKKILVVDDSMMIRQMLFRKLTKIGFNVEISCDGMDAIEKSKTFEPDLIIMDQIMPRLNGLDAIIEIKKFAPDIKFMMLSSSSRPDELITAKTLNVLTYLVKPVKLDRLFKEIANTLMNKANDQKGAQ